MFYWAVTQSKIKNDSLMLLVFANLLGYKNWHIPQEIISFYLIIYVIPSLYWAWCASRCEIIILLFLHYVGLDASTIWPTIIPWCVGHTVFHLSFVNLGSIWMNQEKLVAGWWSSKDCHYYHQCIVILVNSKMTCCNNVDSHIQSFRCT